MNVKLENWSRFKISAAKKLLSVNQHYSFMNDSCSLYTKPKNVEANLFASYIKSNKDWTPCVLLAFRWFWFHWLCFDYYRFIYSLRPVPNPHQYPIYQAFFCFTWLGRSRISFYCLKTTWLVFLHFLQTLK